MESALPVLWSPVSSLGVLGELFQDSPGYQVAQVLISQELFIRSPLYTASQMPSPWSVAYNNKYTTNMLQRIFIPSSLENNHKIEVCPWSAQTQLSNDCLYFCLCVCHSPCVEVKDSCRREFSLLMKWVLRIALSS